MSTAVKRTSGRKSGRYKRKQNSFAKHAPLLSRLAVVFSAALLFCGIVGGSLAFLNDNTSEVVNAFEPGKVTVDIEEGFNGTVKSSIKVKNSKESDTDVYIRVKLVSYRVDENGDVIGGSATIDDFELGNNWVYDVRSDFYYYKLPVEPNALTNDMILVTEADNGIVLEEYPDGSKQVIEVLTEAIQKTPADAVEDAWGVSVNSDDSLQILSGN